MPGPTGTAPRRAIDPVAELEHATLTPEEVRIETEPLTVEQSWILGLYTRFHSRDYRNYRVEFPSQERGTATAHFLVPPGDGPHAVGVHSEGLCGLIARHRGGQSVRRQR